MNKLDRSENSDGKYFNEKDFLKDEESLDVKIGIKLEKLTESTDEDSMPFVSWDSKESMQTKEQKEIKYESLSSDEDWENNKSLDEFFSIYERNFAYVCRLLQNMLSYLTLRRCLQFLLSCQRHKKR